jgi:hypothetical protein
MEMPLKFLVLGLAFLLAGCESLQAVSYRKAELSGVGSGELKLEMLPVTHQRREELLGELKRYPEIQEDLKKQLEFCGNPGDGSGRLGLLSDRGAAIAGLVTIGAQLLQGRIDRIVASSTASYSALGIVKPDELRAVRCLLVTRWSPRSTSTPTLGMLAILQLDHSGVQLESTTTAAFLIRPAYLRMLDSVAATRNDIPPVVDIAAALSIHALAEQDLGIERFTIAGESVVTIPQVAIGPARAQESVEPSKGCALRLCTASTPVTYPKSRGSLVLKVAIAEQGLTGFGDKDIAKAQIAALKEALGPVIEARYTKN